MTAAGLNRSAAVSEQQCARRTIRSLRVQLPVFRIWQRGQKLSVYAATLPPYRLLELCEKDVRLICWYVFFVGKIKRWNEGGDLSNEQNLRYIRTTEEARELGRKGGKASGEARRRKANFRKTLNMLLTMEIDDKEWAPLLKAMGLDSTLETALNMAMIKEGLSGNVKAYEAVARYSGQSDQTEASEKEQKIRTDRAKRARDQEIGDESGVEENIQNFLKAVNPTKEDMDELFKQEDEDAEETEEAGGV